MVDSKSVFTKITQMFSFTRTVTHCGIVTIEIWVNIGSGNYCLMAPSHYLNQCRFIIKCVLWHSRERISQEKSMTSLEITRIKLLPHLPRANESSVHQVMGWCQSKVSKDFSGVFLPFFFLAKIITVLTSLFLCLQQDTASYQEQLANAEDKLAAADNCMKLRREEINALQQAYNGISKTLEVSFGRSLWWLNAKET